MTTHRFIIELRWSRNLALALAMALALPILAVAGLLTALAAHPGAGPANIPLSAPNTLSYQGQVKVNGQPFTGTGQFKFAIVSGDGVTVFWTNDGTHPGAAFQPGSAVSLTVTAGLFNVLLGDTTLPGMTQPITSGVFLEPSRALRVWFSDGPDGFQKLTPDVALAAVPYALNAQTLDGLDSSAFAPLVHTHSGADIVAGTINDARLSANVVLGGQGVSRLSNDLGYLTQPGADARYARISPTTQQIALLKWYTAVTGTGSTFPVGVGPWAIAFDGANMWVTNSSDSNISVLRASDGFHVFTPTAGAGPIGMAFDGANMWVANWSDGTVSALRASDGFHVFTPAVGAHPYAIAFDGANMWVTNYSDNTVSVLRASDGFPVFTLAVGAGPQGIAFDGANVWVTNRDGTTVSVLRASDGSHVMTPTVGTHPVGIAFDGANMWVANSNDNTVSVLRASDGSHVMTPTVGTNPIGIAFDGANMWVANTSDVTVSVLRASDGFHVITPTVGGGPRGPAFDGAFMWVANYFSGTVSKR
jgi:hypothetical protein